METIKTLMTSIVGILIAIMFAELYYLYLDKSKQIKQEDKLSKIKLAVIVIFLYELFLALFFLILSLIHLLTRRFEKPFTITQTLITKIFSIETIITLIIIVEIYFFYLTIKKKRNVNYRILDVISIAGGAYFTFNILMIPLCFLIIYIEKILQENFGTVELTSKTLSSPISLIVIIQLILVFYIFKLIIKNMKEKFTLAKIIILAIPLSILYTYTVCHFNGIKDALLVVAIIFIMSAFAISVLTKE